MNYEELYAEYQTMEKGLKDALSSQQKTLKRLAKNMEIGDLKNAAKDLSALGAAADACARHTTSVTALTEGFDTAAYVRDGHYTQQVIDLCKDADIDIKGEGTVYEVFPYRVKIDPDNQDVYIDRKRYQTMRPAAFVGILKSGRDRLMRAAFTPSAFAEELAAAYDLELTQTALKAKSAGKTPISAEADVYLSRLYGRLVPMRRLRREYDEQNFAFDLARLYISGFDRLEDGRRIQFGPGRLNARAIRILDGNGQEQYLSTVRFFND